MPTKRSDWSVEQTTHNVEEKVVVFHRGRYNNNEVYTPGQSHDGKQNKHSILESSASGWEEFFWDLLQLSHVRTVTSFPPTCMLWDEKKTETVLKHELLKRLEITFHLAGNSFTLLYQIETINDFKTSFSLSKTFGMHWCDHALFYF